VGSTFLYPHTLCMWSRASGAQYRLAAGSFRLFHSAAVAAWHACIILPRRTELVDNGHVLGAALAREAMPLLMDSSLPSLQTQRKAMYQMPGSDACIAADVQQPAEHMQRQMIRDFNAVGAHAARTKTPSKCAKCYM